MLDALLVILNCSLSKGGLIDNLADILENKVIHAQVGIGAQPVSFLVGFDDGDISILPALETLVLASSPTRTISIDTFELRRAINAIGVFSTGKILAIDWNKSAL